MSKTIRESGEGSVPGGARIARALLLAPIALYRLTISPLLGVNCRHVPSCSDYAREAVDTNGAWKGGWLALSGFAAAILGAATASIPCPT